MLRRITAWFVTAAVILTVLYVGVLLYKYFNQQPLPPQQANCQSSQAVTAADVAVQVHLFDCKRGGNEAWQGQEVWLYDSYGDEWLRLLSAPPKGCLALKLDHHTRLRIEHQTGRGNLHLSRTSVVYEGDSQGPYTLAIQTQRVAQCST